MSARRSWLGLVALVAVGLAVLVVWRLARSRGGEAEEPVAVEVPVKVGAIARATLQRWVATFGTVEPSPAETGQPAAGSRVASPVTGAVSSVRCVEGQRVARGDELLTLDSRVADAQVERARKALAFAEQTAARQEKLLASDATSEKARQEAEQQLAAARSDLAAATAERALLRIVAPVAGTVLRVNVRAGEAVDPSTALVELADLGRLVVAGGVRSAEAALVKVGQEAELSASGAAGDEKPIAAKVTYVGAGIDPRTDTVPVRVEAPAGARLVEGAFLSLRIAVETRRDCLAAPEEAIVRDSDGRTAIAVVEGEKAVLTPVRAGVRDRGLVEVEGEGLKDGTPIVVEGAYGLPKEAKIKPTGP